MDSEPIPDGECDATGRYMPLATGNQWTYEVTDRSEGVKETKSQEVGALQMLEGDKAGIEAFRMTTTKPGGTVVSWQEDTGDAILRHREIDMAGGTQSDELYEPYKLRIAEDFEVGASWMEDYVEHVTDSETLITTTVAKSETWTIEAVDEAVAVPAGSFCTMRVRKATSVNGAEGAEKTYWFARGVGKVKEDNGERLEELADFQVQ